MRSTSDVIRRAENLEDVKAFYHGILGFALVLDTDRMVGFETGALTLYFERGAPNGNVFEFQVDDVSAERDRLLANGCVLVEEDPALPRCYLRDNFGLTFNLTRTYH